MGLALKKIETLESCVDEIRDRMPPGAMVIGGEGDPRPADALRRLETRLNCEVVIIPGAGHEPWMEVPERFGAVLRAAVERQPQPARRYR